MKASIIALAGFAAFTLSATATVTLQINSAGFEGESGQLSGITWGIVVDNGGDGFDVGLYEGGGWSLVNDAILTGSDDDFYYTGSVTPGGGFVTTAAGVTDSPGNQFAVIWFQSGIDPGATPAPGQTYGFYTEALWTMPAPGSASPFPATGVPGDAGDFVFQGVPEPSIALLGALGVFGLIRRRR